MAIGGNDFDSQFIRHLVAPALGASSTYTSFGKTLPMPQQLYAELERWDKLSFLKTRQTLSMLHEIRSQAHEPGKIEGLLCVIEEELGYQLYKAIESIKFTLSTESAGPFVFHEPPVELAADVTREAFEAWIRRDLDEIRICIDQLLEQCRVTSGDIDSIFMTGGTSLVPMVRRLFEDKFSPDRLRSGGELTSVARGLALRVLMR